MGKEGKGDGPGTGGVRGSEGRGREEEKMGGSQNGTEGGDGTEWERKGEEGRVKETEKLWLCFLSFMSSVPASLRTHTHIL